MNPNSKMYMRNFIWIDILIHLPVKPLLRFRCVSRFWLDLIKSAIFIDNHLLKQQTTGRSLLLVRRHIDAPHWTDVLSFHDPDSPELEKLRPDLYIDNRVLLKSKGYICVESGQMVGPCNGLVCLFIPERILLCNPTLREFKQFPSCPFSCPLDHRYKERAKGFGNNIASNEFKIVVIKEISNGNYEDECLVAHVYNLSTNCWRQINGDDAEDVVLLYVTNYYFGKAIFFVGSCHWYAGNRRLLTDIIILCFDFNAESFKRLEYPDCFLTSTEITVSDLIVVNDCFFGFLAYGFMGTGIPNIIDVWVMKEYGVKESWTKQLVIGPYFLNRPLICYKNEWILGETPADHDQVSTYRNEWNIREETTQIAGQLSTFALHTNRVKRHQEYGSSVTFSALVYNESLLSVDQVMQYENSDQCEEDKPTTSNINQPPGPSNGGKRRKKARKRTKNRGGYY